MSAAFGLRLLSQEVGELIARVEMIKPFSLHETMVPAAVPDLRALHGIDEHLARGRAELIDSAQQFLVKLQKVKLEQHHSEAIYRRYVSLRLRVNAVLTQYDLFSDAISQRSEADTGVWLAGLDALAQDALRLTKSVYKAPPLLCFLDRGIGAAIRRADTRLPGGGNNPVAIIRVPRERMVGLGVASSLVHEAGHQGAALLGLVASLQQQMKPNLHRFRGLGVNPWAYWYRWISEIVADCWSVARLGVASTLGLLNVVSLPRVVVFRANQNDPHPTPWIRLLISAEIGRQLYPHGQWNRLQKHWCASYPTRSDTLQSSVVHALAKHIPELVHWMLLQPLPAASGQRLAASLKDPELSQERLEAMVEQWFRAPHYLRQLRPCRAFAVAGYCRLARGRTPVPEIPLISSLLTDWALAN